MWVMFGQTLSQIEGKTNTGGRNEIVFRRSYGKLNLIPKACYGKKVLWVIDSALHATGGGVTDQAV